ncbi:MAG: hypothetical protein IPH28_09680 [Cytophagaceae bacterium]|nr:hypothetical protein [Cytophagaceae bacterium]MBK9509729.1 hypothetical protein [Cytophagaceae bacterium]MBK9933230.1 hypothetical protein [Cytophagaceae bacterium]MBL0303054.1 hypothetical protein [Cytophagaceae bacterium]
MYIIISLPVMAQETPYYQEPNKRKKDFEKIAMPNLESFTIKYYTAINGGFGKSYFSSSEPVNFKTGVLSPMESFLEVNFGINRNEKYYFETGISKHQIQLNSFYAFPFRIYNNQNIILLPVKTKRTIWVIDRVSRSAFLLVGAGLDIRLNNLEQNQPFQKIFFDYRQPPELSDPESIEYQALKKYPRINFETNMEIRGKVTERFELGLFTKLLFSGKKNLSNQLNLNFYNGDVFTSFDRLTGTQLWFGLNLRLNSPTYFKYKAKAE